MNADSELWLSKEVLAGGLQALGTVVAVCLAYGFALKQLHRQSRIQRQQDLRRRQADALHSAWALLQCLSLSENGHSLVHYQQDPGGQRRYFMHLPRAQAFVFERLPASFYASGAGLHWSTPLKDRLFKARSMVHGFLLKCQAAHPPQPGSNPASDTLRPMDNEQLALSLETLHTELLELLRQDMQAIYAEEG